MESETKPRDERFLSPTEIFVMGVTDAVQRAQEGKSKLTARELRGGIEGRSSDAVRHLMNNLGNVMTRYLELGTYQGSTLCAATACNHLTAVAIDSHTQRYRYNEAGKREKLPKDWFRARLLENIGGTPGPASIRFFNANHWTIDHELIRPFGPFDFYFYDGDHRKRPQAKALPAFIDLMADIFVHVVDDYNTGKVQAGTRQGIKACGLEVVEEWHLGTDHAGVPAGKAKWWGGLYVGVLKKIRKGNV